MLTKYDLALQITPKIEAHNSALQITPEIEANTKTIISISTHATRVSEHVFYNSPAPRLLASNVNSELKHLNYVIWASQSPLNSSLAQQNTSKNKQLFQIRSKVAPAQREPHINQSQIPPNKTLSPNIKSSPKNKISAFCPLSLYNPVVYFKLKTFQITSIIVCVIAFGLMMHPAQRISNPQVET